MTELKWTKSSFSEASGNNCVEVAAAECGIALRESVSPNEILVTSSGALNALVLSLKEGSLGFLPQ